MIPHKSVPVLKGRPWGGQKLKHYHKEFGEESIGESWETDIDTMPVLIKLIDAKELLSVQVHPDDHKALLFEGQPRGKTEAWIVLSCEEDAEIVAGLRADAELLSISSALEQGDIIDWLNRIKVKAGDCIYIPAGMVHSLGKGIVVYEVQQPSDLTYRLYDWERKDERGCTRELHIEKALSCIDYSMTRAEIKNLYQQGFEHGCKNLIFQSDYFRTYYVSLLPAQSWSFRNSSFTALTLISGEALLHDGYQKEAVKCGDTWIIPEVYRGRISITAQEALEIIVTEYD